MLLLFLEASLGGLASQFHLFQHAGRRHDGKVLGNEIIACVAGSDFHQVARFAQLANILIENDLYAFGHGFIRAFAFF